MPAATPIDLVIFDCDDVLVESERLINRIEARLLSQLGLDWQPDQARAAFKGHTVGEIVTIIETRTGVSVPAEWLYDWGMQVALGFVKELRSPAGLRDALEALRRQGIPACVASQAPRARVELALEVTELARVFGDHVFTAAMVPRSKPHPDVLLYAAARMGAEPTRCVVVEDSPSGIRAAVAAGMKALGYAADEDAEALERAGAERTFRAMDELPALVACLRQPRPTEPVAANAAAQLRLAYEAFAAGDVRSLFELLAEEVVYHLPGQHLGGGTIRGRAEVFARMSAAARTLDEPATIRVEGVVGFGEWVLSTERLMARRGGRALDQEVCVVWRIVDGRCVEVWSRFCDQASCDRFWRA